MTEDEAIALLEPTGDNEVDHVNADNALIDFLRSNGYVKLADAYDATMVT